MDYRTSLYLLQRQNILLLLSNGYIHMPMILLINCFDLQAYLEHEGFKKVSFG